jgi:phosphatidylserine decarboxylase
MFQITCYRCVPLRSLSRVFGWVSETRLPGVLRPLVYSWYARLFGVNLEEASSPDLSSYNCLAEFFARGLKAGLRPIDEHHALVSTIL